MIRGQKPKPTKAKELAGNPGCRPLNKNEPKFVELSEAEPPQWLDDRAVEAWEYYAPKLLASRVMSEVDLHNLAVFCAAYARWRVAEDEVAACGITIATAGGEVKKNPAVTVINESVKQMAAFGGALGLDPASRARLSVPREGSGNHFADL